MKRLILGIAAFAYLSLIGLQAAHVHAADSSDHCQICVITAQAVRHAPASAPTISRTVAWTNVSASRNFKPIVPCRFATSARAPPLA